MSKLSYLLVLGIVYFFSLQGCGNEETQVQQHHEEVIMRKIGHEILLQSNDSTSLVRPIIYENDKYTIQFDSSFSFLPDDLVKTIDTIIKITLPYKNYIVQVQSCENNQVVYSYEYNHQIDTFSPFPDILVACSTREQPKACYEIIIQFFKTEEEQYTSTVLYMVIVVLILFIGVYAYKRTKKSNDDEKIEIGAYLYNPKKMTLTLVNNTIELTSKESELLNLLYESVNETVDRDTILNKVWGDEGDYVGRTLDVFISKLRKKLEHDPSIELKNIRGIGYKLIID